VSMCIEVAAKQSCREFYTESLSRSTLSTEPPPLRTARETSST